MIRREVADVRLRVNLLPQREREIRKEQQVDKMPPAAVRGLLL